MILQKLNLLLCMYNIQCNAISCYRNCLSEEREDFNTAKVSKNILWGKGQIPVFIIKKFMHTSASLYVVALSKFIARNSNMATAITIAITESIQDNHAEGTNLLLQ